MEDEYDSSKYGYCPHEKQFKMFCPKCGGARFVAYPQSIVVGAPVWCHEYACMDCGAMLGIEVYEEKR